MHVKLYKLYLHVHTCKYIHKGTLITFQVVVTRPPNYTLLMIWLPVIGLAFIIGYLKRENLHILYVPKYWAMAAMVRHTYV